MTNRDKVEYCCPRAKLAGYTKRYFRQLSDVEGIIGKAAKDSVGRGCDVQATFSVLIARMGRAEFDMGPDDRGWYRVRCPEPVSQKTLDKCCQYINDNACWDWRAQDVMGELWVKRTV